MERARITTENSKLLKELVRFFNLIQWLPNAHGIRFFSEKPWDKVPPSWQTALLDLSEEELYMLSNDRSVRKRTWPLSLQCFFALIDRFQIENIAKKEYLPAGVPKYGFFYEYWPIFSALKTAGLILLSFVQDSVMAR